MGAPVSVRLDDDVRRTLEGEAKDRGVGLATYLRQIAAEAARDARRKHIRGQRAVSPLVAATSKARVRATGSRITPDHLQQIRRRVAEAIGLA